jgi:D-xylose transport system ATP-binding protein
MTKVILATRNLVKRFEGIVALAGVDFTVYPGEIQALCGENGAGKSTLIKTLCGIIPFGQYEGDLLVDEKIARFSEIRDAQAVGIAVIVQELALVPDLTVAENLALGREPSRLGRIDWLQVNERARALCEQFGVKLDVEARVGSLSVGQQQLVEILRALGLRSRVLILDEPTAALSEKEAQKLLDTLRNLRRDGIACVYISHRLDEVFSIADRITVLRDGQTVYASPTSETDRNCIIRHMVGRDIKEQFPTRHAALGRSLLSVKNLDVDPPGDDGVHLRGLSFDVHAGEVFGIGGLLGAGRSELLLHLFGAWGQRRQGEVLLCENAYPEACPAESLRRGLVLVTEDRKGTGLHLQQDVAFNLSLAALQRYVRFLVIDSHKEHKECAEIFERLRIKAPDLETRVAGLSGGNQQKVVLGKALLCEPRVFLLDEPTRGIDVGAKREIYELIAEFTEAGHAVVLVSSELPELIGLSDRILMLGEGLFAGIFERPEASPDALLHAAIQATDRARRLRDDPSNKGPATRNLQP